MLLYWRRSILTAVRQPTRDFSRHRLYCNTTKNHGQHLAAVSIVPLRPRAAAALSASAPPLYKKNYDCPPSSSSSLLLSSCAVRTSCSIPITTSRRRLSPSSRGVSCCFSSSSAAATSAEEEEGENAVNTGGSSSAASSFQFPPKRIQILYASQTGTAQLFAMQLAEAAEEEVESLEDGGVDYCPINEYVLDEVSKDDRTLYIFLVSTAGVGEPPDNARQTFQQLEEQASEKKNNDAVVPQLSNIHYSMFALGNSKAHANNFCAFGKNLDTVLQQHGAKPILPITLGDDGGDSLDDDFDQYQEQLLHFLQQKGGGEDDQQETTDVVTAAASSALSSSVLSSSDATSTERIKPSTAATTTGTSAASMERTCTTRPTGHYPNLKLQEPDPLSCHLIVPASDLWEKAPQFYNSTDNNNMKSYAVVHNSVIRNDVANTATNPSALREMQVQLHSDDEKYETGDHFVIYPRNSDLLVEAYLNVIQDDPDPHAIIEEVVPSENSKKTYPHPLGISIYETLRHCVDLQHLPSPSFARYITGNKELDYKRHVAIPRRTVLDLLLESNELRLTLSDLLFQLPPLHPRYYSIASSNLAHPDTIYLTYRPVKYSTARGMVREGLCTSYLASIPENKQQAQPSLVACIKSNPTFRLPETNVPILLLAGGCGVAPIRAFLEELIWNAKQPHSSRQFGKVHLFLGFRNPEDAVYSDLVQEAMDLGILADDAAHITYTTGCVQCALVSDALTDQGATVYDLLTEQQASTYICGGARTFGVAIQNAVHDIVKEYGGKSDDEATAYLQELIHSGRYHEDLSD